jgi:hypothetical protein
MNERIKELKHQASLWCDKNIPEQYSEETNGYGRAWEDKFAELLIRECAYIVENSPWRLNRGYKAIDQANLVKQHFGVES